MMNIQELEKKNQTAGSSRKGGRSDKDYRSRVSGAETDFDRNLEEFI